MRQPIELDVLRDRDRTRDGFVSGIVYRGYMQALSAFHITEMISVVAEDWCAGGNFH